MGRKVVGYQVFWRRVCDGSSSHKLITLSFTIKRGTVMKQTSCSFQAGQRLSGWNTHTAGCGVSAQVYCLLKHFSFWSNYRQRTLQKQYVEYHVPFSRFLGQRHPSISSFLIVGYQARLTCQRWVSGWLLFFCRPFGLDLSVFNFSVIQLV